MMSLCSLIFIALAAVARCQMPPTVRSRGAASLELFFLSAVDDAAYQALASSEACNDVLIALHTLSALMVAFALKWMFNDADLRCASSLQHLALLPTLWPYLSVRLWQRMACAHCLVLALHPLPASRHPAPLSCRQQLRGQRQLCRGLCLLLCSQLQQCAVRRLLVTHVQH